MCPHALLRIALLLFVTLMTGACTFAEDRRPGRWSKASPSDKSVIAAAEFALRTHSTKLQVEAGKPPTELQLLKIVSAEQQIVAGTNYRMRLLVRENERTMTADVVVWSQPWNQRAPFTLTEWTRKPAP